MLPQLILVVTVVWKVECLRIVDHSIAIQRLIRRKGSSSHAVIHLLLFLHLVLLVFYIGFLNGMYPDLYLLIEKIKRLPDSQLVLVLTISSLHHLHFLLILPLAQEYFHVLVCDHLGLRLVVQLDIM